MGIDDTRPKDDWLFRDCLTQMVELAALSLGALYWHESRHPGPFLPIDLLRMKAIGLSTVLIALFATTSVAARKP